MYIMDKVTNRDTLHSFVANIHLLAEDPLYPIDAILAGCLIANWHTDGVEMPEGITPEALAAEWNEQLGKEG